MTAPKHEIIPKHFMYFTYSTPKRVTHNLNRLYLWHDKGKKNPLDASMNNAHTTFRIWQYISFILYATRAYRKNFMVYEVLEYVGRVLIKTGLPIYIIVLCHSCQTNSCSEYTKIKRKTHLKRVSDFQ